MKKTMRLLAATLLVVLIGSAFTANSAGAVEKNPAESQVGTERCIAKPQIATGIDEENANLKRDELPIDRWSAGASSFHTRLDHGKLNTGSLVERGIRGFVAPISLSIGNAIWSLSVGIVKFADSLDVLNRLACQTDVVAASVGNAANGGSGIGISLLSLLAVGGIILALWRSRRGRFAWKDVGHVLGVVVLFTIMLQGANQTASNMSGGVDGASIEMLGRGSPGWFAARTNSLANVVIRPVIDGVATGGGGVDPTAAGRRNQYGLGCQEYVNGLHTTWNDRHPDATPIPSTLSALWEQTGLAVWYKSQFGSKNNYGLYTYCHMLERQSGVPLNEQNTILDKGIAASSGAVSMDRAGVGHSSLFVGQDPTYADIAYVFLASCRYNGSKWKSAPIWGSTNDDNLIVNKSACESGWEFGPANATNDPDELAALHEEIDNMEEEERAILDEAMATEKAELEKQIAEAKKVDKEAEKNNCSLSKSGIGDCFRKARDVISTGIQTSKGLVVSLVFGESGSVQSAVTKSFDWTEGEDGDRIPVISEALGVSRKAWHYSVKGGKWIYNKGKAVAEFLGKKGGVEGPEGPFNWSYTSAKIDKATSSSGMEPVADYMNNLHGYATGDALLAAIIYAFTSFMMLFSFGVMGLSVIVAKIASVIMIIFAFFAVLMSVIPTRGTSKLSKFMKFWIGTSLYTYILSAILALMVMIIAFLSVLGTETFGPGSVMATIWIGFAPLTAMYVIRSVAKKALGFSPFGIKAGIAFGALAGAAGGAAMAGAGQMGRDAGRMGRSGRSAAAAMAGRGGLRKGNNPLAKGERKQTMPAAKGKAGKQASDRREVKKARRDVKAAQGKGLSGRLSDPGSRHGGTAKRAGGSVRDRAGNRWANFKKHPGKSTLGTITAPVRKVGGAVTGAGRMKKLKARRDKRRERRADTQQAAQGDAADMSTGKRDHRRSFYRQASRRNKSGKHNGRPPVQPPPKSPSPKPKPSPPSESA